MRPAAVSREPTKSELTVLVLAPTGRNVEAATTLLSRAGIAARACTSIAQLCDRLQEPVGAVLIEEEAIASPRARQELSACLGEQPPWSDLPFIVLTRNTLPARRELPARRLPEALGNVMFLERPLHAFTFTNAVHTALRARHRQYQVRDHLAEREETAAKLRELNQTLESRVEERAAALAKAEEQLRQAQKMEAIGQLTGGVAHDFNNLLTGVLGNLELLETRLRDEQPIKLVQAASRSAWRGAQLTQQLLAFARRQVLTPEPIDLNVAVSGMSEMLRRTIGEHGVEIRTVLGPSLWPALVDTTQIEVAILNLRINARDAMPVGGRVVIATRNIPAGARDLPPELRTGDYVLVSVTDSGEGMDPETVAKAFDPFFTTKAAGKGTGLGLSQVYGLARQSGGTARIRSTLGQGTTAEIYLQRAAAPSPEKSAETKETLSATRDRTVLVADDQDDVREVIVAQLEALGYRCVPASNGSLALDLLARGNIDILLVDYAMPGLSGVEVIQAARQTKPGLAVVLVTGYAQGEVLRDRLERVALLKKPFRIQELAAAIAQAWQVRHPSTAEVLPFVQSRT
jgi:signal transduction histidine kinase/ActR/RegA family two-component response regulator